MVRSYIEENNIPFSNKIQFFREVFYFIFILFKKIYFFLLIIVCFIFLNMYHNNSNKFNFLISTVDYSTRPFVFISAKIENFFIKSYEFFSKVAFVYEMNEKLINENIELKQEILNLEITKRENFEFKEILNFTNKYNIFNYITANVNVINKNHFIHRLKINIGKEDYDLEENDIVLNSQGYFVGRVVDVRKKGADILLISDITSKIPAILNSSRTKVILAGNNSEYLDINYFLNNKNSIIEGEKVFTTNDGNSLAEGLYIGKIVRKNDKYMVKLNKNFHLLNSVVIMKKNNNSIKAISYKINF